MTKRVTLLALLLVVACAIVWAGDTKTGMTGKPTMEAMKAEMMKCAVCKNVAMHMDEIGPMGMEAVKLNDGLAIRHWVKSNDPAKLAAFHSACEACNKAGAACMTMTDDQAKTDLCQFCQGVRSAMKAGAKMSQGSTKNGDMMVMTSADQAVQTQLSALQQQCATMAAMMEPTGFKASANSN
jgi:hypothetical protein